MSYHLSYILKNQHPNQWLLISHNFSNCPFYTWQIHQMSQKLDTHLHYATDSKFFCLDSYNSDILVFFHNKNVSLYQNNLLPSSQHPDFSSLSQNLLLLFFASYWLQQMLVKNHIYQEWLLVYESDIIPVQHYHRYNSLLTNIP